MEKLGYEWLELLQFKYFQDDRRPLSWILEEVDFYHPIAYYVPNTVQISGSVAEIFNENEIQNGGCW